MTRPFHARYPRGKTGFEIRDTRFETRDSRHEIRDTRFETRDSGFEIRDSRFEIRLMSLHWWGERMVSRRVGFAHHPKAMPLNNFGGGLRDGEPRRPPMRRHEPEIRDSRSSNKPRNRRPVFQLSILEFRLSNLAFRTRLGKGNGPGRDDQGIDGREREAPLLPLVFGHQLICVCHPFLNRLRRALAGSFFKMPRGIRRSCRR